MKREVTKSGAVSGAEREFAGVPSGGEPGIPLSNEGDRAL